MDFLLRWRAPFELRQLLLYLRHLIGEAIDILLDRHTLGRIESAVELPIGCFQLLT